MKESICQEVTESVKFDIDEQNDEMTSMRKEIRDLQDANDEAEQYSRRIVSSENDLSKLDRYT